MKQKKKNLENYIEEKKINERVSIHEENMSEHDAK